MFPLSSSQLPASPDDLCTSIREGFSLHKIGLRRVAALGESASALDSLEIDLTDATLDRALRLPKHISQETDSSIAVKSFRFVGEPLFFETTPVHLNLRATDAVFALASSSGDESLLVPKSVAEGELTLSVAREALEAALQELATAAAGKQGVEIKKTRLELTSRTSRTLSFRAEVTAKMFIMSATVVLTGELEVDDELAVCVSNLHYSGSGMAASAAGAFIQPYLKKYEGTKFSLLAFSLGDVKLREIAVSGGDALGMHARFS